MRLEGERGANAACQLIHDRRGLAKLEKEGAALSDQSELGGAAERMDQAGTVRQRDERQLSARDGCKSLERSAVVESQLDRRFGIRRQRPLRVDKSEPPSVAAGNEYKQVDPAVISDARRTMAENAGTVVGISATRPEAMDERAQRAGRAGRPTTTRLTPRPRSRRCARKISEIGAVEEGADRA